MLSQGNMGKRGQDGEFLRQPERAAVVIFTVNKMTKPGHSSISMGKLSLVNKKSESVLTQMTTDFRESFHRRLKHLI